MTSICNRRTGAGASVPMVLLSIVVVVVAQVSVLTPSAGAQSTYPYPCAFFTNVGAREPARPSTGPGPADRAAAVPADAALSGTVLDEERSTVAGLDVRIYDLTTHALVTKTRTHTNGTYWISSTILAPGRYQVRFSDPGQVYALEWFDGSFDQAGSTPVTVTAGADTVADMVILHTGSVTGTVIDQDTARPLAGIDVRLTRGTPGGVATRTTTDATGAFSVTGVADGEYIARFSDPAGGHVLCWNAASFEVNPSRPARVDAILPRGGQVGGTVTDGSTGLAGIDVRAYYGHILLGQTFTGPGGVYALPTVVQGDMQLRFRDPTGAHAITWYSNTTNRYLATNRTVAFGAPIVADEVMAAPGR